MESGGKSPPAGWYRNPNEAGERWWDGERWTEHIRIPDAEAAGEQRPSSELADRVVGALAGQPRAFWMAGLGLVVIIIGSLGPWVRALFVTVSGMDGDGVLFIIGAAIALASLWAYASTLRTGALIWPTLVGALVAVDSGRIISAVQGESQATLFGEEIQVAQLQWGIYATLIGGAVVALCCLYLAIQEWQPQRPRLPSTRFSLSSPRRLTMFGIGALAALAIASGVALGLTHDGPSYYSSVDECLEESRYAPGECERLYGNEGFATGQVILIAGGAAVFVGLAGYMVYSRGRLG